MTGAEELELLRHAFNELEEPIRRAGGHPWALTDEAARAFILTAFEIIFETKRRKALL